METLTAGEKLKNTIKALEFDQEINGKLIKKEFNRVSENVKPMNLIKNTLNDVVSSPTLVIKVLGIATGLATGYFTKKLIVGSSVNLVRRFLGTSIQVGVTKLVAQPPKKLKSTVLFILKFIRSKTK